MSEMNVFDYSLLILKKPLLTPAYTNKIHCNKLIRYDDNIKSNGKKAENRWLLRCIHQNCT